MSISWTLKIKRSVCLQKSVSTRPLYSSAMGKAVLAHFTEEQYQRYIEQCPLVPFTEYTITNSLKLKKRSAS